jgi:hypothetical protein
MDMDTDTHRLRCILFSSTNSCSLENVAVLARGVLPRNAEIIRCLSLSALLEAVRKPGPGFRIVIICVCTREDLVRLAADRSFLEGCEVIVILPDPDGKTLRLGLKLYPRYMTVVPEDAAELGSVLQAMVRKNGHADRADGGDRQDQSHKKSNH